MQIKLSTLHNQVLVYLLYALILIPNFLAIIMPFENWPYTNAPMFAHYIDDKTPRYTFKFWANFKDSESTELGYYSIGANWSLPRYFFKYVYGAVGVTSVFNIYPDDTKVDFETRLSSFFSDFTKYYLARNTDKKERLQSISLYVARLSNVTNKPEEQKLVGTYYLKSEKFVHLNE